jgi:protein O-mannosyl-transferase
LLALTATAHRQLWYWRDSLPLWEHAAEVTRDNWMAEDFLGELMIERRQPDEALAHYRRALAINPDDPISNINIGSWNQYAGRPREAIPYYQKVLQLPRAPTVLKTQATEGLRRAYRDLGIIDTSGAPPKP